MPNIKQLPVNELIIELNELLCSINVQLTNFISSCVDFQDKLSSK